MKTHQAIRVLRSTYQQAIERGDTEMVIPTEVAFLVLRYKCSKMTTPKPYASELNWEPLEQAPSPSA